MITRKMLLALGKDKVGSLEDDFRRRKNDIYGEASKKIGDINTEGFNGNDLLQLAELGKNMNIVDAAADRLSYFCRNFDTGGVDIKARLRHTKNSIDKSDYPIYPEDY